LRPELGRIWWQKKNKLALTPTLSPEEREKVRQLVLEGGGSWGGRIVLVLFAVVRFMGRERQ